MDGARRGARHRAGHCFSSSSGNPKSDAAPELEPHRSLRRAIQSRRLCLHACRRRGFAPSEERSATVLFADDGLTSSAQRSTPSGCAHCFEPISRRCRTSSPCGVERSKHRRRDRRRLRVPVPHEDDRSGRSGGARDARASHELNECPRAARNPSHLDRHQHGRGDRAGRRRRREPPCDAVNVAA